MSDDGAERGEGTATGPTPSADAAPGEGSSWGLPFALLCQLVLSVGYLLSTPAFEAPDEFDHLRYAYHVSHTGELPIMRGTWKSLGRPKVDEATQAYHPPAYYALLALTMRLTGHADTLPVVVRNETFADWDGGDPGLHLHYLHGGDERRPASSGIRFLWGLRLWSVFFGLVAVAATHRLGRLAYPTRPVVADLAATLLACLPKWSYMHGMVNNGIPASACAHVVVLLLATAIVRRRFTAATGLGVGLLAGLAVMSKLTALFLLPVMFTVYVAGCWRWRAVRRSTVVSALLALAALAATTAWFFLRNRELYGSFMALDVHQLSFAERIRVKPEDAYEWITTYFYPKVFTSMVGHFGWWILPPLRALVVVGQVLVFLAAFGWVLRLVARRREASRPRETDRTVAALLLGVGLVVFAVTFRYNFMMRGPHARYLFPAMGSAAVLFAAGLVAVGDRLATGLAWAKPVAFATPLALGLGVLLGQFRPAFDPSLAPADRWHASMVTGLRDVADEPELALLEPADGAALAGPPRFCWSPATDVEDPVYTLHVFSPGGRIHVAAHEYFQLRLEDTCWEMPPEAWALLPPGEELLWTVRRVPDREAGESETDVPASGASRITRLAAD